MTSLNETDFNAETPGGRERALDLESGMDRGRMDPKNGLPTGSKR
jgi:hypothetical protein